MNVREEIDKYIDDQPVAKSEELRDLHRRILEISPDAKLGSWMAGMTRERSFPIRTLDMGRRHSAMPPGTQESFTRSA